MSRIHVTTNTFGTMPDGSPVDIYAIRHDALEISVITLGGIITMLRVPDRAGHFGDVVLGHETLTPYLDNRAYLGAIVGRYANRIARGRFALDGEPCVLSTNAGPHHLHGGCEGFDRRIWTATPLVISDGAGVTFARVSASGEEGYPGTMRVAVTYLVTEDATVRFRYEASTDAPTILNLTQHTYFNLAGERSTSILDHELQVHADRYLPVDDALVPTGELLPTAGTPFDLRTPTHLGTRIAQGHPQMQLAGGFDHTFVLPPHGGALRPAASLRDPRSGRSLQIATTEPGLQVYTGQQLDGRAIGAHQRPLARHAGLCLEPQHFPDAPNHPNFPSTTLRPGRLFASTTTWRFHAK